MEVIREVQLKRNVTDYTLCDKCNQKIKKDDAFDVFKSQYKYMTGDQYPEGGSGDLVQMDLCQNCTEEFLLLLQNNGYRINKSEWDT